MTTDTLTTSSPRSRPVATLPALLVCVVLLLVAVLGVHDLTTARGWADGTPWLTSVASDLDGLTPAWWTTAIAGLVVLLGLVLLWTALRPARRTHRATPMDDGDVWVSKRALRRLAGHAAERTAGVESAHVRLRRRRVEIRATTAALGTSEAEIRERVTANVTAALAGFSDLSVTVRSKEAPDVI
ncbi:MAG: hypothetical protein JWO46_2868 [Nocardioidaceae bacterium]|nr:hypothetical protein [Nocardioidaceae bacterium]